MRYHLIRLPLALCLLGGLGSLVAACGDFGQGMNALSGVACPEITSADAARTRYSDVEPANIKLRAFVQAAKDLATVAAMAEAEAAEACRRMGADLGVPP